MKASFLLSACQTMTQFYKLIFKLDHVSVSLPFSSLNNVWKQLFCTSGSAVLTHLTAISYFITNQCDILYLDHVN